jgi:hypothetical protein
MAFKVMMRLLLIRRVVESEFYGEVGVSWFLGPGWGWMDGSWDGSLRREGWLGWAAVR